MAQVFGTHGFGYVHFRGDQAAVPGHVADFAVVQSYLSTAAKWGIDALDALIQLFTTGPWLPVAIRTG